MDASRTISGAGLGLRRGLVPALTGQPPDEVDFMEMAPENWMGMGGRYARQLRFFTERYPFVCHGLSLSLGGPDALDEDFIRQLKGFLQAHDVSLYSEHLSYCAAGGHLYELMPLPFTAEAVHYAADRIRRTQDLLEQRIAVENVTYYAVPEKTMDEAEFVREVIEEADCDLLLDVNNTYVNGRNHGYDPRAFIAAMPADRIAYLHVAGHYREPDDLIIDTHGAEIIDPVWDLLDVAYECFGPVPTLLERDFNLPPLNQLLDEVAHVAARQQPWRKCHEPRCA